MKIGIGVTTYNRPECLKECLEYINKHTFMDNVTLYIATDTDGDRRGVAYRKNECLRALKDCDYIFLFDDDCFPIKDGWIENWACRSYDNGMRTHFLYMDDKIHKLLFKYNSEFPSDYSCYTMCGGCFMAMSKKDIQMVGAFNEKFELYGFEHAEWSLRVENNLGLVDVTKQMYYMLNNTSEFIYSHDYSTPNHKSSISDEEKQKCIKNNWDKFFNSKINSVHLPL